MTAAERRPLLDQYVRQRTLYPYLRQIISSDGSTIPLTLYCVTTGLVSAVAIDTAGTWVGFQTGNVRRNALDRIEETLSPFNPADHSFVTSLSTAVASLTSSAELAMAVPALIKHEHDAVEQMIDLRRFLVLIAFLLGVFGTSKVGPRGPQSQTRWWIITSALANGLLLALAAGLIRVSEARWVAENRLPSEQWSDFPGMTGTVLLAFVLGAPRLDASYDTTAHNIAAGCQGYTTQQLSTSFKGTIVLTTTWIELVSDPMLFAWSKNFARTQRILAISGLIIGAIVAELLTTAVGGKGEGGSAAIAAAAVLCCAGAVRWWWVREAELDSEA